jgi:mRNA-degrading endonuclease RelE of RelBE toxin-antitoxin system
MRYAITLAPEAANDLKKLNAHVRAEVRDAIEIHLRHQPTRTGKSRIKRLRAIAKPQYRLRVGEVRVFYDVDESTVFVLAIIPKSTADAWLRAIGER